MNQRRLIVLALGFGLSGHGVLLPAQPSRASLRRVGVLAPSTKVKDAITLKSFFDQMRELGWVEGQNRGGSDAGFDAFLSKPIDLKEFVATVKRLAEGGGR